MGPLLTVDEFVIEIVIEIGGWKKVMLMSFKKNTAGLNNGLSPTRHQAIF